MTRPWLVVLAGLLSGVGAHFGYYYSHRPCSKPSLTCELEWIRGELKLTDAQYAEIRQLHEASGPRLAALSIEAADMRRQLQNFEAERRATDRVDFLEFAQFVEQRRKIDELCLDSTRSLVQATARLMSPAQRKTYFEFVASADPSHRID